MSDLTSQDSLKTSWDIDVDTGTTTLVIADSGDVPLLSIEIESSRCRTFLESLAGMAREYFPDVSLGLQGSKTTLDKNAGTGVLEFG